MAPDVTLLVEILTRLQKEAGAQVSVNFLSETGTTGLTIPPIRLEAVTVDSSITRVVLPYGLGLLTLDAQDLNAAQKVPASDAWRLDFGPLSITIEFGGTP